VAVRAAQPIEDLPLKGVALEAFCDTFSWVPTPVSVVTTINGDGRPHGTTVSAFCSLSVDPPLVLVALDRSSDLLGHLKRSGRFGLNLLAAGQQDIGLACSQKGADKFEGVEWYEEDGLPRIRDAAAWLACDVEQILPGGDHLIVTGLITHCERVGGTPLVYHRRRFHELPWIGD
jgi:flavin reductase (DIM6/NTAB) family NADH-FMN oxidoreductase RutF